MSIIASQSWVIDLLSKVVKRMPTGGGSNIEANPEGDPTDYLNKIKIDETIYSIKGSGGSGDAYYAYESYSTEERVIGCWKNGKPIYSKTYNLTSPSSYNSNSTIGTLDVDFDEMIDIKSMFLAGAAWQKINSYLGTSDLYNVFVRKATKEIAMRVNHTSYTKLPITITFQYTKTTDAENSFSPSMISKGKELIASSPNYEMYDLDTEKIIGRWYDGRPIYRKTIKTTVPAYNGADTIFKLGFNIDSLVSTRIIGSQNNGNLYFWSSESYGNQSYLYLLLVNRNEFHLTNKGSSGWNGSTCYVIVEYTKSTDAENSFTVDMIRNDVLIDVVTDEEVEEVFK